MNYATANSVPVADQAAGLRNLLKRRSLRVLPVLGDHDTVSQGACAAHLAQAMARGGRAVMLLDAVGAAVTALALKRPRDLAELIRGQAEIGEVAQRVGNSLRVMAAREGLAMLVEADAAGGDFFAGFLRLDEPVDTLVINLAPLPVAGGGAWLPLREARGEVVLVMAPGEQSLTSAYATIKQLAGAPAQGTAPAFRVLVNGAAGERDARAACRQLADTARRFLGVAVSYAGNVPRDTRGRPLGAGLGTVPHADAARSLARLAGQVAGWRLAESIFEENPVTQPH
jgi:flagellar biosynthesis protein FlhG